MNKWNDIYHKLFEHSSQGIAIIQGNPQHFVYANPSLTKMLGYNENELTLVTEKKIEDFFYPTDKALLAERIASSLKKERTFSPI